MTGAVLRERRDGGGQMGISDDRDAPWQGRFERWRDENAVFWSLVKIAFSGEMAVLRRCMGSPDWGDGSCRPAQFGSMSKVNGDETHLYRSGPCPVVTRLTVVAAFLKPRHGMSMLIMSEIDIFSMTKSCCLLACAPGGAGQVARRAVATRTPVDRAMARPRLLPLPLQRIRPTRPVADPRMVRSGLMPEREPDWKRGGSEGRSPSWE